jgi:hypothetical protein
MSKRTAADLVKNSGAPKARGVDWYQRLPDDDQNYVRDVVKELIANPNAALYLVAEQLVEELGIDRHPNTVANTLKRMMKDGQAKREKASR